MSYSTSSDTSSESTASTVGQSPRSPTNKSKIPRYTAMPNSPVVSPRGKHVQFERVNLEDNTEKLTPSKFLMSPRNKIDSPRHAKYQVEKAGQPVPPTNFRVTRRVGSDSLLVAWTIPKPSDKKVVNATATDKFVLSGYLIFVNDELHQKVRSPNRTKALLNRLDLSKPITISIQSLTDHGAASNKAYCNYTENMPEEIASPPTSARSLDERINYNYKRQCIISCDYTPSNTIEKTNSNYELSVHRGDIVTIFGEKSGNDFYYAEVNGKRGLVPAHLIREIHSKTNGTSIHNEIHSD